ncbi:hypothetical protein KTR10_03350 [Candidatus Kaiserbacteria bacterium]|nr:hypothetical protein [Candidatus Kaiserbacteria bacterium]
MKKYVTIEKKVGETPLVALEKYRSAHSHLERVPMAYAGRLDPMASGRLLLLIGEECKQQEKYHGLDKAYEFSVLFDVSSDTGDVLGRLSYRAPSSIESLKGVVKNVKGDITLPYPHFSSKTVEGKPLHVWTLEGRVGEIDIPTYTATIYQLRLQNTETKTGAEIADEALQKIETIPPVTEESKALGRDFRRDDVRSDWKVFREMHGNDIYTIAHFSCVCSSGAYMRTLAEEIAKKVGTEGLAYSIHRTKIGRYVGFGIWSKTY